jgi:hypothetical protein
VVSEFLLEFRFEGCNQFPDRGQGIGEYAFAGLLYLFSDIVEDGLAPHLEFDADAFRDRRYEGIALLLVAGKMDGDGRIFHLFLKQGVMARTVWFSLTSAREMTCLTSS